MPPRIHEASQVGTGFKAWWEGVPPITRYMAAGMVLTTVACNLGVINPMWLALFWQPVLRKFEIWRLFTNFFYHGKLSINFVVRIVWVYTYAIPLEKQIYQFEPADYMFMLLFNGLLCILSSPVFGFAILGAPLIMSIIYIWARNFPDQQVSLYGIVKIQSFFLPFAFACISLLMGQSIVPDLVGIAVGHIYWYLKEIYPAQRGHQVLTTPSFLRQWLADAGLRGNAPPPQEASGAPQGFQAFRGGGRRLGD
mmetsp:Transcript_18081/g.30964  ORF Transcript_18081/g.30964 Transcript_18081/m.30964 type:complete len:252 (+) Transcript_18081:209-964(+)|eukprot:CAMPEP_0119108294 /NCGR_PEP_ID=MMETSP1180-20130426/13572_1 /TAXON_ID=3052 ORGANISM="Chlamydomonas cf sp, Strain CCMP681" /NCGR_SAMPLE_ID=MMETSP1180 /ASSEMBLY_ACC=CAM_ASM_000741 /LENGTH=251 /DNA_ID=CAMNT_0007093891 /DNA_START=182 /DNA_END=937 /DNA_ORIENTATION=-